MEISKLICKKEVSSSKTKAEDWGSLTWLADKNVLNTKGVSVGHVVIKRGMSNPRHCHPNCEEVLYLLKGRLEHTIGDKKIIVEEGDALLVEKGVFHNATSLGDTDASMIVVYSASERQMTLE